MDNKLPNVNKDKPVWRCVDWSTNKANERFLKGKNRYDPYIYDFVIATYGVYMPDEQLDLKKDDSKNLKIEKKVVKKEVKKDDNEKKETKKTPKKIAKTIISKVKSLASKKKE